jgi:hypothetical protein
MLIYAPIRPAFFRGEIIGKSAPAAGSDAPTSLPPAATAPAVTPPAVMTDPTGSLPGAPDA